MKMSFLRSKVLSCTVALLFVPQLSFAAAPQSRKITDVVLHEGGVLVGQLVDAQAQPLAGQQISLRQANHVVATVETNKQGRFAVRGLRSGIYALETSNARGMVAAWNANAAPPTAHQAVLLTSVNEVVRGQVPIECEGGGVGWAEATAIGLGTAGVVIGIIALNQDAS
jgi:hypothetical protein